MLRYTSLSTLSQLSSFLQNAIFSYHHSKIISLHFIFIYTFIQTIKTIKIFLKLINLLNINSLSTLNLLNINSLSTLSQLSSFLQNAIFSYHHSKIISLHFIFIYTFIQTIKTIKIFLKLINLLNKTHFSLKYFGTDDVTNSLNNA